MIAVTDNELVHIEVEVLKNSIRVGTLGEIILNSGVTHLLRGLNFDRHSDVFHKFLFLPQDVFVEGTKFQSWVIKLDF